MSGPSDGPASPTIGRARRVRSAGATGTLIETTEPQRLAQWVNDHPARGHLTEVIPGARTVYLAGPAEPLHTITAEASHATLPLPDQGKPSRMIVIDVRYDGPDLEATATHLGLSPAELVELHTSTTYTVHFFGFSPGQAFFGELPTELRLPRRPSPRVRVPAGAVAIANEFTVIYPQDSPGGWNLIGTRVSAALWDVTATPPNRVDVGDRIQFRSVA